MRFTIVTPSYNQGAYIERTIESVLSQTGVEVEYFVLDNCSTDGTEAILERYRERENLQILRQPDRGQYDAINQGWLQGEGEILGWLNADDVYLENALAAVAEYFATHPEVMAVYGEAVYLDRDDRVLKPVTNIRDYSRRRLLSHDFITQPATFIRRPVFDRVGLLTPDYRYVFDWDYWIRISCHYDFVRIPVPLAGYRITGDNLTTTGKRKRLREMLHLVWRYGGPLHLCRFIARLLHKYLLGQPEIPAVD